MVLYVDKELLGFSFQIPVQKHATFSSEDPATSQLELLPPKSSEKVGWPAASFTSVWETKRMSLLCWSRVCSSWALWLSNNGLHRVCSLFQPQLL